MEKSTPVNYADQTDHVKQSELKGGYDDDNIAQDEENTVAQSINYDGIENHRHSEFRGHVHKVSIALLWGIFIFYGIAAICWLWHLLAPEHLHFMLEKNYNTLQGLLFGTIVSGFANQFAQKVFSRK